MYTQICSAEMLLEHAVGLTYNIIKQGRRKYPIISAVSDFPGGCALNGFLLIKSIFSCFLNIGRLKFIWIVEQSPYEVMKGSRVSND